MTENSGSYLLKNVKRVISSDSSTNRFFKLKKIITVSRSPGTMINSFWILYKRTLLHSSTSPKVNRDVSVSLAMKVSLVYTRTRDFINIDDREYILLYLRKTSTQRVKWQLSQLFVRSSAVSSFVSSKEEILICHRRRMRGSPVQFRFFGSSDYQIWVTLFAK